MVAVLSDGSAPCLYTNSGEPQREERPKLPLSLGVGLAMQTGIHSRQASLPEPKAAASRPHYTMSPSGVFLSAVVGRGTVSWTKGYLCGSINKSMRGWPISTPVGSPLSLHPLKNYPYRWIYAIDGPLCETVVFGNKREAGLKRSFQS